MMVTCTTGGTDESHFPVQAGIAGHPEGSGAMEPNSGPQNSKAIRAAPGAYPFSGSSGSVSQQQTK